MKVYHLVDVSGLLYAGAYVRRPDTVVTGAGLIDVFGSSKRYPTSAAFNVLRRVQRILEGEASHHIASPEDICICVFDPPYVKKKDEFPEYKAGRKHPDSEIMFYQQKEFVKKLLNACGVITVEESGYEADDVIWTLVEHLPTMEQCHVIVHSRDQDMLVNCSESCDVIPKLDSKELQLITRGNFEAMTHLEYNSIPLRKLCLGDSSDRISGIGKKYLESLASLACALKYSAASMRHYSNVRKLVESANKVFPKVGWESIPYEKALRTLDLLEPRDVPIDWYFLQGQIENYSPASFSAQMLLDNLGRGIGTKEQLKCFREFMEDCDKGGKACD